MMKRKTLFLIFLGILAVIVSINASPQVRHVASRVSDRMLLFVHIARLYTKDPDTQLSMPVKNVSRGSVANTWQAPRGADRKHEGQDIFAPRGTYVISATSGYVLRKGENPLGGRTVSVVGAGGRTYYYAHLEDYAPDIAVGKYVTRDTVLGFVGTSGNAQGTPPHLHFGVYGSAGAINPLPLLIDRPARYVRR
jgi:murein DD-endopeptidase MepM/ murein hydrolase activator NlpD